MTTSDEGSTPENRRYVTRVDPPAVTDRDVAADIASLSAQNRRLVSTLQQAREQIVTLKTEIDQLAQPPSGFAIFIGVFQNENFVIHGIFGLPVRVGWPNCHPQPALGIPSHLHRIT